MAAHKTVRAGLTVAVTGPTGEIGQAVVAALERSREVGSILGMARRPFDPRARGWKKVYYRRATCSTADAVQALVQEADVVVHLAFMIMGGAKESREVNLVGSRNVFEASVSARAKRLVYASSVAAYGFHRDNPQPLTEEVPARGTASPLLLGAEGRGRGAARGDARGTGDRPPTYSARASSPDRTRRC